MSTVMLFKGYPSKKENDLVTIPQAHGLYHLKMILLSKKFYFHEIKMKNC